MNTVYVCGGSKGADGATVAVSAVALNDATCPGGGVRISAGSSATFVCNGLRGTIGDSGVSVTSTPLGAGDAHCAQGGSSFTVGAATTYACNGTDAWLPSGTVVAFAGTTVPPGWLPCDGSAVSRTANAALFAAIGISAGGGNGTTTFNVPDYGGRFLRGVDAGAGHDPGAASRTAIQPGGNAGDAVSALQAGDLQAHNHGVNDPGHSHTISPYLLVGAGNWSFGGNNWAAEISNNPSAGTTSNATGISIASAGGAETRPVNVGVHYLINL